MLLALGWILWATMHSFLISPVWLAGVKHSWPGFYPWYRLSYNIFALLTLGLLLYYKQMLTGLVLLTWPIGLAPLRWAGLIYVFWLAWAGAKVYDLGLVGGVKPVRLRPELPENTHSDPLYTHGILQRVRHPWYSAGLVLLWTRTATFDWGELVTSIILTLYLLIGAWWEEKKLVAVYGPAYQEYQKIVPMFWPRVISRS
jgi:protein-S-isoprenylcysteine O-methyltransferase Ste14